MTAMSGLSHDVRLFISPGWSAPISRMRHFGYSFFVHMSSSPQKIFLSHNVGLFQPFSQPRIVRGTPISLLKLFSLFRTCVCGARRVYIASFVDVFPTLPVTPMIVGLYLRMTALDSAKRMWTTICLIFDFIFFDLPMVSVLF